MCLLEIGEDVAAGVAFFFQLKENLEGRRGANPVSGLFLSLRRTCLWTPLSFSLHSCRVLLTGADVNLAWGRRYGLVGRNGLGKTTLLKMLATRSLRVPAHISLLHVEQEVAGDDTPALQSVLESDTVREDLLCQEQELSARIASGR